jgi:hypothetical protein
MEEGDDIEYFTGGDQGSSARQPKADSNANANAFTLSFARE